MKQRLFQVAVLVVATVVTVGSGQAYAAKPAPVSQSDPRIGSDISYPQCGKSVPGGQAFGVVGINGGKATTTNTCLDSQLRWATGSTGGSQNQPAAQVYINTANPGEVLEQYAVDSWPTDNIDDRGVSSLNNVTPALQNPYGACLKSSGNYRSYTNSIACSWQYGWNRAVEDVDQRLAPVASSVGQSSRAADYTWWLDVETMNTWQTAHTPEAYARNTAVLEGMTQFLNSEGASHVGLYSTAYQWKQIVGPTLSGTATGSNLKSAGSWLAGSVSATDAKKHCITQAGLTGGPVIMNQYISRNIDYDYSCI